MTPFSIVMLYFGLCALLIALKVKPLQPDQPLDDIGAVDVRSKEFQVNLAQADWRDRPWINVRLSRKWVKE